MPARLRLETTSLDRNCVAIAWTVCKRCYAGEVYGIQAGPTFFSAFAADGARHVALAFVVAGTAVGLAFVLAWLIGLEHGFSAGMLPGALTSTPTLAGAQDAANKRRCCASWYVFFRQSP